MLGLYANFVSQTTQYKKECMVFPYESTGHLFNVPPGKVAAI